MSNTKLFFVVDSPETNEEIFETLEEAQTYLLSGMDNNSKARIRIAMVRNYFKEPDLNVWNYDDYSDTFEFIKTL